ncbi:hypothetical protein E7T06_08685 [Deinococcus sp. Arct2-2]|uniref:hypothetical protein n=1 Tax=Deinococcus sp. Arct2-2 TaxID=2568653 RepID=UPI00113AA577|nr:hypothetical protein [Deinococcus sp. Arct2-2]THF70119.1 hypothetical protein E7T06_08685 [Deinococcus sp. Arct2-2]
MPGQAEVSGPDELNQDSEEAGGVQNSSTDQNSTQGKNVVQSVRTFVTGQSGRNLEVWVSQPRTLHDQGVSAVRTASFTVMLLVVACILLAMRLLDLQVFTRLTRLRRFVQRIETEPDTAARLHLGRGEDELHLVARALNLTLDRVTGDHDIMRAQGEALRLIAENGNVDDVMRVIQGALERKSPGALAELQSFGAPTLTGANHMGRVGTGPRRRPLRATAPDLPPCAARQYCQRSRVDGRTVGRSRRAGAAARATVFSCLQR